MSKRTYAARFEILREGREIIGLSIEPEERTGQKQIENVFHRLIPFAAVEYDGMTYRLTFKPVGKE